MADKKISELTAVTTLDGTEEFPLSKSGGLTRKVTASDLGAGIGDYVLLSETVLSVAGTFDVSSIDQSYRDLVVELLVRSATGGAAEWLNIRLNNDSGSNYDFWSWNSGSGGGASGSGNSSFGNGTSNPTLANIPISSSPANAFAAITFEILQYTNTSVRKATMHRASSPLDDSGDQRYFFGSGEYRSTSAVNRIQVYNGSGANLVSGSRCAIYGRGRV